MRDPRLYKAPEGTAPPPHYVRALLILTCTGVSFAHGSNDGQKGMGLIMLILVGTVPTAYALNHAVDRGSVNQFAAVSTQVAGALGTYVSPAATIQEPGTELQRFIARISLSLWHPIHRKCPWSGLGFSRGEEPRLPLRVPRED